MPRREECLCFLEMGSLRDVLIGHEEPDFEKVLGSLDEEGCLS
jgi:hypothetical protein